MTNSELLDRLKRNPVIESVILKIQDKDVKIEDRSNGKIVQIWINDVPHLAFNQDNYKISNNWKMTKHGKRFNGNSVFIFESNTGKLHKHIEDHEYDNPDIARAIFTIMAKYK